MNMTMSAAVRVTCPDGNDPWSTITSGFSGRGRSTTFLNTWAKTMGTM